MKFFLVYTLSFFLIYNFLTGNISADQNKTNFIKCEGSPYKGDNLEDVKSWTNCIGTIINTKETHDKKDIFFNVKRYEGEFQDGKANGVGKILSIHGSEYIGEFKDYYLHGNGVMNYNGKDMVDGVIRYDGEWVKGKWNGKGTLIFQSDDKYIGEFKDGKIHGKGTITFSDGSKFVGEFKDNDMHGKATVPLADGDKYVGEFKDGIQQGKATYISASEEKDTSEWKNGFLYFLTLILLVNGIPL